MVEEALDIEDNNNEEEMNINCTNTSNIMIENSRLDNDDEAATSTSNGLSNIPNNESTGRIQSKLNWFYLSTYVSFLLIATIDAYFPSTNNSFEQINSLNENTFRIRCQIVNISPIRHFGSNNKVFDGIICDQDGKIKVVAFNEEKIIIENGQVQKAHERYRTPYSMYEIRLVRNTVIEFYEYMGFNPRIKIMRKEIANGSQMMHGRLIGKLSSFKCLHK
ncbi:unnamed protein product [Rotaria sp. Silwood2]|nr:unnamed protein product [Rotaria sp. Silwood2]